MKAKTERRSEQGVLVRLPPVWVKALREIRPALGFHGQQVLKDAIFAYLGKTDELMEVRQRMVREAMKKGRITRPFEQPLAPFRNNALTVG